MSPTSRHHPTWDFWALFLMPGCSELAGCAQCWCNTSLLLTDLVYSGVQASSGTSSWAVAPWCSSVTYSRILQSSARFSAGHQGSLCWAFPPTLIFWALYKVPQVGFVAGGPWEITLSRAGLLKTDGAVCTSWAQPMFCSITGVSINRDTHK